MIASVIHVFMELVRMKLTGLLVYVKVDMKETLVPSVSFFKSSYRYHSLCCAFTSPNTKLTVKVVQLHTSIISIYNLTCFT